MGLCWMVTKCFWSPFNTLALFDGNCIFWLSQKAWKERHEMTIRTKGRKKNKKGKEWKKRRKKGNTNKGKARLNKGRKERPRRRKSENEQVGIKEERKKEHKVKLKEKGKQNKKGGLVTKEELKK